ncbi:hypothetical protein KAR91_85735, partial [Candidatus Pacearchaeota archaeon]|nr:hypothetical protein [Candidatus Pacearchaeota archaeon]
RVYNQVGTFDFKELVENMDIVIEQIVNNMMNGYRDCNKGALHVSKNMVAIVNAAKRVYQKTVAKHLRPYHGVLEMMEGIVKDNREIVGLTDAPKVKTITRLRALKLLGFFKHLYAQPTPKLEPFKEVALECKTALIDLGLNPDVDSSKMIDQLMGKIESNEIDGKTLTRLVELIHKVYDVHRNPHQKASAYITEQCEAV